MCRFEEVAADVARGASVCEFFTPGLKFALEFDKNDKKGAVENDKYAILAIQHSASSDPKLDKAYRR